MTRVTPKVVSCFARRVLERLTRNHAFRKRLPSIYGARPLYVSGDSRLLFLVPGERGFDRDLFSYVNRYVKPNDQVWDIGSNVGQFAIPAAHQIGASGRLLAVEPDPYLCSLLHRSLAERANLDLLERVTILESAVAEEIGTQTLLLSKRGRASNQLEGIAMGTEAGGVRAQVDVMVTTLDSMLEKYFAPNLVKIDVEGLEEKVLRGGARLLGQIRPSIVIEVAHSNTKQVTESLIGYGYRLYHPLTGESLESCEFNTFAHPT